jgi:hypothetical protein
VHACMGTSDSRSACLRGSALPLNPMHRPVNFPRGLKASVFACERADAPCTRAMVAATAMLTSIGKAAMTLPVLSAALFSCPGEECGT